MDFTHSFVDNIEEVNDTIPANNLLVKLIPDNFRSIRTLMEAHKDTLLTNNLFLKERIEVCLDSENGYIHKEGTARVFVSATAPTEDLQNGMIWIDSSKDYEIFVYDTTEWKQLKADLLTPIADVLTVDTDDKILLTKGAKLSETIVDEDADNVIANKSYVDNKLIDIEDVAIHWVNSAESNIASTYTANTLMPLDLSTIVGSRRVLVTLLLRNNRVAGSYDGVFIGFRPSGDTSWHFTTTLYWQYGTNIAIARQNDRSVTVSCVTNDEGKLDFMSNFGSSNDADMWKYKVLYYQKVISE